MPQKLQLASHARVSFAISLLLAIGFVVEVVLVGQRLSYGVFGPRWVSNICHRVAEYSDSLIAFAAEYLRFILMQGTGWIFLAVVAALSGYSTKNQFKNVGLVLSIALIVANLLEDLLGGGVDLLVKLNLRIVSLLGAAIILASWCLGRSLRRWIATDTFAADRHVVAAFEKLILLVAVCVSALGWYSLWTITQL